MNVVFDQGLIEFMEERKYKDIVVEPMLCNT